MRLVSRNDWEAGPGWNSLVFVGYDAKVMWFQMRWLNPSSLFLSSTVRGTKDI
jgi:hypothetical protein